MATTKVVYLGPSDTLIHHGKTYRRAMNPETGLREVEVPMSVDEARHLAAWGAKHRFRIGDEELREQTVGEFSQANLGVVAGAAPAAAPIGASVVVMQAPPEPEAEPGSRRAREQAADAPRPMPAPAPTVAPAIVQGQS